MKAVILLGLGLGDEERVVKEIRTMEGVKDGFVVYGEHDAVIMVEVPSQEKLNAIISRIRRMEGVTRTVTLAAV